ncbi:GTP-dependent dephospho-CoA kinase family protein [Candidatus Bathyarchaeota archaeon]|nr:GTP-dependent dephospho-CoA kinase family protein [Candidatus Bathyarchaeota archaeon]
MPIAYSLTRELRVKLKTPIGVLVRGSFTETMRIFKGIIEKEKPMRIISVGDTVTRNLAENHVVFHVAIVDNRVMRRDAPPITLKMERTVYVKNPHGTITEEAAEVVRKALESNCSTKIVVDGEEDLLTLVAVFYSPENSLVVYGQPHEGIVVVKVTPEKKKEVAAILKTMEDARKAK